MNPHDILVLGIHYEPEYREDYPEWFRFSRSQLCEEFLYDVGEDS